MIIPYYKYMNKIVNHLKAIEQKLRLMNKIIWKSEVEKLLSTFAPMYKVGDLIRSHFLTSIKKWVNYLNNCNNDTASPFQIISSYCKNTEYMIGGMFLYNRYGFTTQISNEYLIYSDTTHGEKKIENVRIQCIKQRSSFFYGKKSEIIKWVKIYSMSPERAFLQFIKESGNAMEFIQGLPSDVDKVKLLAISNKYADKKTIQCIHHFLAHHDR